MAHSNIHLLAIESSCDETSAAVVRNGEVLSNIIATQQVHEQYGGVVPEMASRMHLQHIIPVVDAALRQAGVNKTGLQAIAFTQAPGLIGSLLVGASFAKAYAQALRIPLIAVNHMQAHVLAHFIEDPKPTFPFLCLTVSGGHTQIVLCKDYLDMEVLGNTLDDAAGAQMGNPHKYTFPISVMKGYDFSFSGIKTAVLYFLQAAQKEDPEFVSKNIGDICASVQHTIITMLLKKLEAAADNLGITQIGIAGGVSANKGLRASLQSLGAKKGWNIYIPDFAYCTDNAAMIGITAWHKYLQGNFSDLSVTPQARASWS
jgi:N6-L-threonylcarbamoyladenine synthase